jgi:hypothetical protein
VDPVDNKKWAKFTYVGKETRFITKLFKETNIRISFSTSNTITKILNNRIEQHRDKYDNCVVYQLACPDCQKRYTGQTGGSFKLRFSEHYRDFKYNNKKSKFAQHLLEKITLWARFIQSWRFYMKRTKEEQWIH